MKGPIRPTSRRRLPGREPYVVTALRRKYAELKGILAHRPYADHTDTLDAIRCIGGALRVFNPTEDLSTIAPVRPYKGNRAHWTRRALVILRQEQRPMTARALARWIMRERDIDAADVITLNSVEVALHITLGRLEGDGVERAEGEPKRWSLCNTHIPPLV
jgi:hypothetical protein